jgi:hypothetical protein
MFSMNELADIYKLSNKRKYIHVTMYFKIVFLEIKLYLIIIYVDKNRFIRKHLEIEITFKKNVILKAFLNVKVI